MTAAGCWSDLPRLNRMRCGRLQTRIYPVFLNTTNMRTVTHAIAAPAKNSPILYKTRHMHPKARNNINCCSAGHPNGQSTMPVFSAAFQGSSRATISGLGRLVIWSTGLFGFLA